MTATLAFDVYGTLIDTQGVLTKLQEMIGQQAQEFSRVWRDKQLEYSFRRGLMQQYENFAVCTSHALDYTCAYCKADLSQEQKKLLLNSYRTLPAFDDVKAGLTTLKTKNFDLYAFSNGRADAVEGLLLAADIRDYFIDVVSVDDINTFKPNPAVYQHFLQKSGASNDNAWLISSNPFDVLGALAAGMQGAWVQRSKDAIFDPWGIEPTITVNTLAELEAKIT